MRSFAALRTTGLAICTNVVAMRRFSNISVASVFKAYPPGIRAKLMALRELVFDTAEKTPAVGRLTETLKWGQPSYLTQETGSGTTVRIDRLKAADGYAAYFHCQSGLVEQFRELYPDTFTYEGKRAIVFGVRAIACRRKSFVTASPWLSPITPERRSRNREHHRLFRPPHPHHEPQPSVRHPRGGARRPHPGGGNARRAQGLGHARARRAVRRQGHPAGLRRGPQPRLRGRRVEVPLCRLLRPHQPGGPALQGAEEHRRGRGGLGDLREDAGAGRVAARLGLRSDLFRRPAHGSGRPRQGLDRSAGRGDPFQLPRRQRQHARAGQGRHHAHHQRARHRQGRQGRADRRAAGDGGQIHGLSRRRRGAGGRAVRRAGGVALRPGGAAGRRHHGHRSAQRAAREHGRGLPQGHRLRRFPAPPAAGLCGGLGAARAGHPAPAGADEKEQRAPALPAREDRDRRLDPGPVGAHALAGLLRRHAQRRVERRP